MSAPVSLRRVVTGIDAEGKSCIVLDGALKPLSETAGLVWRTEAIPADNSGTADCPGGPFSFELMHSGGSMCMVMEYPPGIGEFWHATDTIDYIVMLKGEVVLQMENGEARLKAGDFAVDRGVLHNWRNDTDEPALAMIVILPAHPVGKGRNV
jgi:quercetin dioxygenase-like cupin family protein